MLHDIMQSKNGMKILVLALLLVSCAARRFLQGQEPTYKVRYTAAFRNNPDTGCDFPDRVLEVYCLGNITVTRSQTRDDDQFVCVEDTIESDTGPNNWSKRTCSKCSGSSCPLGVEAFEADWGFVDFECYGENLLDTDGFIIFRGGSGSCESGVETEPTHEATLGVACPTGNQGRQSNIFDDRYVECLDTVQVSPVISRDCIDDEPVYACVSAPTPRCDVSGCSFEFEDVEINADVGYFRDKCVESTVDIPPFSFDAGPAFGSTNYESSFQATFGRFSNSNNCFAETPTLRLECPVGEITLVRTEFSSTKCSEISPSELQCTDATSALGRFVEVAYLCKGPIIQPTVVEFLSSSATCNGNAEEASISQKVQLGIACGRAVRTPDFSDSHVECGVPSNRFELLESPGSSGERYTCGEEVTFPAASQSENQQIPSASVMTEFQWQSDATSDCYTRIEEPTVPPTMSPSTPFPTVSPVTKAPMSLPTIQPSALPTTTPWIPSESPVTKQLTNSPTTLPTITSLAGGPTNRPSFNPTISPATESPTMLQNEDAPRAIDTKQDESSRKINVNAIVGGTVGALVCAAIAGAILLRKCGGQSPHQSSDKPKDDSPPYQFTADSGPTLEPPIAPPPGLNTVPAKRPPNPSTPHAQQAKYQVQSKEKLGHGSGLPQFKDQVQRANRYTHENMVREKHGRPKPQKRSQSDGFRMNAPLVSATPVDITGNTLDGGRGAEPRGRVLREPSEYHTLDLHEI